MVTGSPQIKAPEDWITLKLSPDTETATITDALQTGFNKLLVAFSDDVFAYTIIQSMHPHPNVPQPLHLIFPYLPYIRHVFLHLKDLDSGLIPHLADVDRLCYNIEVLVGNLPSLETIQIHIPDHMVHTQYKIISYKRRRICPVQGFLARSITSITQEARYRPFDHLYVNGLSIVALAKGNQVNMGRYITEWNVNEFSTYHRFHNRLESWRLPITQEVPNTTVVETGSVQIEGAEGETSAMY